MSETWIRPYVVENGQKRFVTQAEVDADAARQQTLGELETASPPPLPEADISGMSPTRAALLAFHRWRDGKRKDLAELEVARAKALEAFGAPAATEAALAALVLEDQSGVVAWLKNRAGVGRPELRGFERQQLEERLLTDRHAAECATGAIAEIDAEITRLCEDLVTIEGREADFVADVVAEAALPQQQKFEAMAAKLRAMARDLLGCAVVVGATRSNIGQYQQPQLHTRLPAFRFEGPSDRVVRPATIRTSEPPREPGEIVIGPEEAKEAATPWRALAERLAADPHAV
jgi:hypothetical protein